MTDTIVTAEATAAEIEAACSCCGRPIYEGAGELQSNGTAVASYWYRWSEGHEGRFTLAIGRRGPGGVSKAGVAVVAARIEGDSLIYRVLDPDDSPWKHFSDFGPPLTRDQALADELRGRVFELVDLIAAREARISDRILSSGLAS